MQAMQQQQQSRLSARGRAGAAPRRPTVAVRASSAKETAMSRGKEWLSTILSRFGPATERAQNVTTLDFERPLLQLDQRIKEVRDSP